MVKAEATARMAKTRACHVTHWGKRGHRGFFHECCSVPKRGDDHRSLYYILKELFLELLEVKLGANPGSTACKLNRPFWRFMTLQVASVILTPSSDDMTLLNRAAKKRAELTQEDTERGSV